MVGKYIILALRKFWDDQCLVSAASLTFSTLFALVPSLAVIFGVANHFGASDYLESYLYQQFIDQTTVVDLIVGFARQLLGNVKSGVIAGVGLGLTFTSIIVVLSNIESTLNLIWGIINQRKYLIRFGICLALIVFGPILLISSLIINVYLIKIIDFVYLVIILEMLFAIVFFSFLYKYIPNTYVSPRAAVVTGVVISILLKLSQWGLIKLQGGVINYGVVYGSFAALPLFFVWLQISWSVILFGGELSFILQHRITKFWQLQSNKLSFIAKLAIANRVIQVCRNSNKPLKLQNIVSEVKLPLSFVYSIVNELIAAKLLTKHNRKYIIFNNNCRIGSAKQLIAYLEINHNKFMQQLPSQIQDIQQQIYQDLNISIVG